MNGASISYDQLRWLFALAVTIHNLRMGLAYMRMPSWSLMVQ
jgi:hypothetical protein